MSAFLVSVPRPAGIAQLLIALVDADGSAGHPYPGSPALAGGAHTTRNMADAVHYLCVLHGRQPDVVDQAAMRDLTASGTFLAGAAQTFGAERALLARLSVAAGPLPSTPGQADSEAAVLGQHHALSMLARSDRTGTALGAAAALLLDWRRVRVLLDAAAHRLGIDVPPCRLPDPAAILDAVADAAVSPGVERAIAFGAQQLLLQQRGFWDLLEAREIARRGT